MRVKLISAVPWPTGSSKRRWSEKEEEEEEDEEDEGDERRRRMRQWSGRISGDDRQMFGRVLAVSCPTVCCSLFSR